MRAGEELEDVLSPVRKLYSQIREVRLMSETAHGSVSNERVFRTGKDLLKSLNLDFYYFTHEEMVAHRG